MFLIYLLVWDIDEYEDGGKPKNVVYLFKNEECEQILWRMKEEKKRIVKWIIAVVYSIYS